MLYGARKLTLVVALVGVAATGPRTAAADEPAKEFATYTASVDKGGCEDVIAVGLTFHGPLIGSAERPNPVQQAIDACKQAHPGARCASHAVKDPGSPLVMAAAEYAHRCYDGGTVTRIGIGFGATSEEAWRRAAADLALRSSFKPSKDTYKPREERPVFAPPPLASDEWRCADGRTSKLVDRAPSKRKHPLAGALQATYPDGSTITVPISTLIADAYRIQWEKCTAQQASAELPSVPCPTPPKLAGSAPIELALGPDAYASAMSKHLCGDPVAEPSLAERGIASMKRTLKGAARLACEVSKCVPGRTPNGKAAPGVRW